MRYRGDAGDVKKLFASLVLIYIWTAWSRGCYLAILIYLFVLAMRLAFVYNTSIVPGGELAVP